MARGIKHRHAYVSQYHACCELRLSVHGCVLLPQMKPELLARGLCEAEVNAWVVAVFDLLRAAAQPGPKRVCAAARGWSSLPRVPAAHTCRLVLLRLSSGQARAARS
jgi:hypothetical protein